MAEKNVIHMVPEPRKSELVKATYGIIGCMQQVHNQLGPGLPEYIYQEALATELAANGYTIHKEEEYHPLYRGQQMKAYLKMDLVVTLPTTKVIIECKALRQLSELERYQTFGYLRGTGWPIALLVNFGSAPKAQIERYYCTDGVIEVF